MGGKVPLGGWGWGSLLEQVHWARRAPLQLASTLGFILNKRSGSARKREPPLRTPRISEQSQSGHI